MSPDQPMPDHDPRPTPPEPPDPGDCCGEGCARCIHDIHDEAMQRHRAALAVWDARHASDDHEQRR